MGKTDTEGLLLNLGKSYTKAKNKGSVYFTLKRYLAPENHKFKPGNRQKNQLIEKELKAAVENPNASEKTYQLHCKASFGDIKVSTEVDSENTGTFIKSVSNLMKIHFFKKKPEMSKKIKKPTQKDPKSKRSMKLKARVQFKKLKKMKKKDKKITKGAAIRPTGSLKPKSESKMDIEK